MSTEYTGNPANGHTATIILPSDGDHDGVSVLMALLEAHQDNHALAKAILEDWCHVPMNFVVNEGTRFAWSLVSSEPKLIQTDVTDRGGLWVPIQVPEGLMLEGIRAIVDGNGGGSSHALRPNTMPDLTLYEAQAGSVLELGSAADPSADVPTYEGLHTFEATGLNGGGGWDPGLAGYYLRFRGEAGVDAVASALHLVSLQVRFAFP